MDELKACPACGSDNILIRGGVLNHYVECMESSCTMAGPARKGAVAARDAWNALPRTDYRALAQQLAEALVKAEALTREAYTFHLAWYMGTIPPGQLNGDASWAAYELATWQRRAHEEIEPALAAAAEAGLLPEVKA